MWQDHWERQQAMVRSRAGWRNSACNGMQYWFPRDGMREALKGPGFALALKALPSAGLLHASPNGDASEPKRTHRRVVQDHVRAGQMNLAK